MEAGWEHYLRFLAKIRRSVPAVARAVALLTLVVMMPVLLLTGRAEARSGPVCELDRPLVLADLPAQCQAVLKN